MAKSLRILVWHDKQDSFSVKTIEECQQKGFPDLELYFWSEADINQHSSPKVMKFFEDELNQSNVIVFLLNTGFSSAKYPNNRKLLDLFYSAKSRGARLVAARTRLITMPEHPLFNKCEVFQSDQPPLCDHKDKDAQQNLNELLVFLRPPNEVNSQAMVFISYSRDDETCVELIKLKLESEARSKQSSDPHLGFWKDSDISPGENWNKRIYKQINGACAVLVVLTPNSVKSKWVVHEWSYALGAKIKVLPLLLLKELEKENFVIESHPAIAALQNIEILDINDDNWSKIYTKIQDLVTKIEDEE